MLASYCMYFNLMCCNLTCKLKYLFLFMMQTASLQGAHVHLTFLYFFNYHCYCSKQVQFCRLHPGRHTINLLLLTTHLVVKDSVIFVSITWIRNLIIMTKVGHTNCNAICPYANIFSCTTNVNFTQWSKSVKNIALLQ